MKYHLSPGESAELTAKGEKMFLAEPREVSEIEKLRAENLRLESEWFVLMADKQLALREVEKLREKLAILTTAFEKVA